MSKITDHTTMRQALAMINAGTTINCEALAHLLKLLIVCSFDTDSRNLDIDYADHLEAAARGE